MATTTITANRRGVLTGALAATLGGVATTSVAAVDNIDAELLALGDEWRRNAKAEDAADEEVWRLEGIQADRTPRPAALNWREGDGDFWNLRAINTKWFKQNGWQGSDVEAKMLSIMNPPAHFLPNARLAHRAREIYEAHQAWIAERDRVSAEIGLPEAESDQEHLRDQNLALRSKIAIIPACTSTGVALKAEVVMWCFGGTREMKSQLKYAADNGDVNSVEMMNSLTLDILRISAPSA